MHISADPLTLKLTSASAPSINFAPDEQAAHTHTRSHKVSPLMGAETLNRPVTFGHKTLRMSAHVVIKLETQRILHRNVWAHNSRSVVCCAICNGMYDVFAVDRNIGSHLKPRNRSATVSFSVCGAQHLRLN